MSQGGCGNISDRARLSAHVAADPTLRLRPGQAFSQRTRETGHPGVGHRVEKRAGLRVKFSQRPTLTHACPERGCPPLWTRPLRSSPMLPFPKWHDCSKLHTPGSEVAREAGDPRRRTYAFSRRRHGPKAPWRRSTSALRQHPPLTKNSCRFERAKGPARNLLVIPLASQEVSQKHLRSPRDLPRRKREILGLQKKQDCGSLSVAGAIVKSTA
jgi:hypothetical protein